MSIPECAVTRGGQLSVSSGSTSTTLGKNAADARPTLTFLASSVGTATDVTSEPVPAVVGRATTGSARSGMPSWGQSRIERSASTRAATTLARSIVLPPPTATTTDGSKSRTAAAHSSARRRPISGSPWSQTSRSVPGRPRSPATSGSLTPAVTSAGSATTRTRWPSGATASGRKRLTSRPKLIRAAVANSHQGWACGTDIRVLQINARCKKNDESNSTTAPRAGDHKRGSDYQEMRLPRPPTRSEMRVAAAITSLPRRSSSAASICGR